MNWTVYFTKKAAKQVRALPETVQNLVDALRSEIEVSGPLQHGWKNFGKLKGSPNLYHCHVKSGRPTYVVCWAVTDKQVQIVEIYYVGTPKCNEKAPY